MTVPISSTGSPFRKMLVICSPQPRPLLALMYSLQCDRCNADHYVHCHPSGNGWRCDRCHRDHAQCAFGGIRANGEIADDEGRVVAYFDGSHLRFAQRPDINWRETIQAVENVVHHWVASPPTAIDREQLAEHCRDISTLDTRPSVWPPEIKRHLPQDLISRINQLPSSLRVLSPSPEPAPGRLPLRQNTAFIFVPPLPSTYPPALSRSASLPSTSASSISGSAIAHLPAERSAGRASVRTPLDDPSHTHSPVPPTRPVVDPLTVSSLDSPPTTPTQPSTRGADVPTPSVTIHPRPPGPLPQSRASHSPHNPTSTVIDPANTPSVRSTSHPPPNTALGSSLLSAESIPAFTASLSASVIDIPPTSSAVFSLLMENNVLLTYFTARHTEVQAQLHELQSRHATGTPAPVEEVTRRCTELHDLVQLIDVLKGRQAEFKEHHERLLEAFNPAAGGGSDQHSQP